MVGFVHFSNFFIPSEKYYKLQSCWITLYLLRSIVKAQKAELRFLDLPSGDVFTNTSRAVLPLIKRGSQLLFSRWRW